MISKYLFSYLNIIILILSLFFNKNVLGQSIDIQIDTKRVNQFGKHSDMVGMNPIFLLEANTIHNKKESKVIRRLPIDLQHKTLAYGFLYFTGTQNLNFRNELVFLVEDYDKDVPKLYVDTNGNLDFTDDLKPLVFENEILQVRLTNQFKSSGFLSYQLHKSSISSQNSAALLSRYKGKYPKSNVLSTQYWYASERENVNVSYAPLSNSEVTIITYDGNADGLLKFDDSQFGDRIYISDQKLKLTQDFSRFIRLAEPIDYNALFKIGKQSFRLQHINSDGSSLSLVPSDAKVKSKLDVGSDISELKLNLLNGEVFSVKQELQKGLPLLLDFGATWCAGCVKQEATIKDLFKNKQINVVGIFDDKLVKVKDYIKKRAVKWPIGLLSSRLKNELKINAYPTYILIGKDGKIKGIDMNSENIKFML